MLWLVRPLGAATILLALGILAIGAFRRHARVFCARVADVGPGVLRYFKIQKAMMRGQFPVASRTVVFITALLGMVVAVTFGILVNGQKGEVQVLDGPLNVLRLNPR